MPTNCSRFTVNQCFLYQTSVALVSRKCGVPKHTETHTYIRYNELTTNKNATVKTTWCKANHLLLTFLDCWLFFCSFLYICHRCERTTTKTKSTQENLMISTIKYIPDIIYWMSNIVTNMKFEKWVCFSFDRWPNETTTWTKEKKRRRRRKETSRKID